MDLTPGTRLGVYEITAQIAVGGMGEVYRARDTKLDRDVAIKILPEAFAHDADRLARFTREAKTLASLNHPNIAAIHGLEESPSIRSGHAGVVALVMELVEGEDLSQRIARGSIPLDEALPIAKQIADALDAAHERGVIHRDLKPANVKVRSDGAVKVLDFGLAKAMEPGEGSLPGASTSPTLTTPPMTQVGMILGTAAYMSPEQARGRVVDKRADIWAFGAVLFEMLTGERAFERDTIPDTIAVVLEREPDWHALPDGTPQVVRHLLRRCLEKDLKRRIRDIGDARVELDEALESPTEVSPALSRRISWRTLLAASGVAWITVGILAWLAGARAGRQADARVPVPMRVVVPLASDARLATSSATSIAVSPDGTRVVYAARVAGTARLFVRDLDQLDTKPLAGTEQASGPFFSPDGRWVGFTAANKLQKIPVGGGGAVPLCDLGSLGLSQTFGASWSADGTIFFAGNFNGGISRVPDAGGQPQIVTLPDVKKGEVGQFFPDVLPGGKALIFTIKRTDIESFDDAIVAVRDLGTGVQKTIVQGGTYGRYLVGSGNSGYVIYARSGGLFALPFDVARLEATGPSTRVVDDVTMSRVNGVAQFGWSVGGTLAYASGAADDAARLAWVDRRGVVQPFPVAEFPPIFQRLSPDRSRLASEKNVANHDIWIYSFDRSTLTRLTYNGDSHYPVWTPDGQRVTFRSGRPQDLFWISADGSGSPERLVASRYEKLPASWSPDGQWLSFTQIEPSTGQDIWVLSLAERKPRLFLGTRYQERDPVFSPDGRWLAYVSNETGRSEIYARPFPGPGEKWQLSSGGGSEPVWSPSGAELFYRNDRTMMAVTIEMRPILRASAPRVLFVGDFAGGALSSLHAQYDVARDGQRFVMVQAAPAPAISQLQLAVNWIDDLKRRVPAR